MDNIDPVTLPALGLLKFVAGTLPCEAAALPLGAMAFLRPQPMSLSFSETLVCPQRRFFAISPLSPSWALSLNVMKNPWLLGSQDRGDNASLGVLGRRG